MDGPYLAGGLIRARSASAPPRPILFPSARFTGAQFTGTKRSVAGFSILEILVALTIGAVILLALGDVLVSSKVSYLREENAARIQESGRFATLALGEQVRPARSLDCYLAGAGEQLPTLSVKVCNLLTTDDCAAASGADRQDKHVLTVDQPLGYDASEQTATATWLAGLPATARTNVAGRWLRGDVLVSWGLAGTGSPVAGQLPWPGDAMTLGTITLDTPITLSRNTAAVITDCQSTDVFTVTAVSDTRTTLTQAVASRSERVNADLTFSAAYNIPPDPQSTGKAYRAQVYPLRYSVFYVCCTDGKSGALQSGNDVNRCRTTPDRYRPALCVWDLGARNAAPGISQPLIPDVADMRVTWGSIPGLTNGFSPDDTATITTAAWVSTNKRWPDVSSARLELLVAGTDENRRVKSTPVQPAKLTWPPNATSATAVHTDTVGAGLAADTRLYQRFVINLAVRSRTPWYLAN